MSKKNIQIAASVLIGALLIFGFFQNCARVGLDSKQAEKAVKTTSTSFLCTQPSVDCERNGRFGTMTCDSTDSGPVWGECVIPGEPPNPTPLASCTFRGMTYLHGQSFTAYENSTVAAGLTCVSQVRTCLNGAITGRYQHLSCNEVNGNCSVAGVTVANNQTIEVFRAASVPYGQQCQREQRRCTNGVLSGSFTYLTCVPDAVANCNFNNQVIPHAGDVVAYQAAQVPFGSSCLSERRACNNGVLSGSYGAASCSVSPPANCTFNGQTVVHNMPVTAYQAATVPFGSTCAAISQVRTCNNGNLSGNYNYASCAVQGPANCNFNGQVVVHSTSVTAYESASVPFGSSCSSQTRTCNNGVLGGNFAHSTCAVQNAQTCVFDGRTIAHTGTVTAYQAASVPFGTACVSEVRTCSNGTLGGNYLFPSCTVQPAAACTFNGQPVAHNAAVTAYSVSSVPFGSSCASVSEARTCSNGTLSGSALFASCSVQPPANCNFNGQVVNHGSSVQVYSAASVPFGTDCSTVASTRTCTNGVLSGQGDYATCVARSPEACVFNGQSVAHNATVQGFQAAQVTAPDVCVSENRTCNNGNLSGSFGYPSCLVYDPPTPVCTIQYQMRNDGDMGRVGANGAWALLHSDQNYDCDDYPGCGIRMGVSCTGSAQLRLKYQFRQFSTDSAEVTTPWSGSSGVTQWGDWSSIYQPGHPEDECYYSRQCGLRVAAETLDGKTCTVSYSYKTDNNHYSPVAYNGAWSSMTRATEGDNDNCDDSECGINVQITCGGSTPVTYPGGGGGGGVREINYNVEHVSNEKVSDGRMPASAEPAQADSLSIWQKITNWFAAIWSAIFG